MCVCVCTLAHMIMCLSSVCSARLTVCMELDICRRLYLTPTTMREKGKLAVGRAKALIQH